MTQFSGDIPMSMAVQAFAGTSFSPEVRGATVVSSYAAELGEVHKMLHAHAVKGGTLDLLEEQFERFRAGYRQRYTAWLGSRSRCMSTMIAGPSNFPVRRQEKRNRVEHKRLEETIDFKARALRSAVRTLRPDLRPIMSGDADAVERLQAEIDKAEAVQARMKAANAAIRKYHKAGPEAQITALGLLGIGEGRAAMLLKPDPCHGTGFASFELTNNGANIRRMQKRLEQISLAKASVDRELVGSLATMNECPGENRVRLTFPGKPSVEVRTQLKSNGFRWTPSLGVWQAYCNPHSVRLAEAMIGEVAVIG